VFYNLVRTQFKLRIIAWHRYQRYACRQGKAHAKIKTTTFDARGNKAKSKLLAGANYVLIVFFAEAHCKSSKTTKMEKDIYLPLDGKLSFFQFSAHSI
jgi:hypothetical protein